MTEEREESSEQKNMSVYIVKKDASKYMTGIAMSVRRSGDRKTLKVSSNETKTKDVYC